MLSELDLPALRQWASTAGADLARHAGDLDRLNVFPVPDGDTGTNLQLTLEPAARALAEGDRDDLPAAVSAMARAALVSARGNSGVILSQVLRGLAQVVEAGRLRSLDGAALARALRAGSDLAWRGVAEPVEGTILTVARAAADGAETAAAAGPAGGGLPEVCQAAVRSARRALEATTEQLPALRRAQVVDAGAAGYLVVLEALEQVVRGRSAAPRREGRLPWVRGGGPARSSRAGSGAAGPAHEVMYLLADSDEQRVAALRADLAQLGDSVVVAGADPLWSVHAHVDDVAAALEAGARAGRPHRFAVTPLAPAGHDPAEACPPPQTGGVVVLTTGDGLAALARAVGAEAVLLGPDGPDPARALRAAAPALVLCDGEQAAATAQEALAGTPVSVVGAHPATVAAVLAVLDDDPQRCVEQAREAVAEVRTALLPDPLDVQEALASVAGLLAGGGEQVTLVTGAGVSRAAARRLARRVRRAHPQVEVAVLEGGSAGHALAVGVE